MIFLFRAEAGARTRFRNSQSADRMWKRNSAKGQVVLTFVRGDGSRSCNAKPLRQQPRVPPSGRGGFIGDREYTTASFPAWVDRFGEVRIGGTAGPGAGELRSRWLSWGSRLERFSRRGRSAALAVKRRPREANGPRLHSRGRELRDVLPWFVDLEDVDWGRARRHSEAENRCPAAPGASP